MSSTPKPISQSMAQFIIKLLAGLIHIRLQKILRTDSFVAKPLSDACLPFPKGHQDSIFHLLVILLGSFKPMKISCTPAIK